MESRSDQELVAAANKGEAGAFEGLYHRYRDWVYRLAWRFTSDEDLALDVLQETFTYLLKKFPGFTLTARMTTFLYPVVKHLAISLQQKRRRYLSGEELLSEMEIAAPVPVDPGGQRSELQAVMVGLANEQREIVLMRFVDGLALGEIAEALGIPSGTVKSRLYRALEVLKGDRRTRKYFLEEG